MVVCPLAGYSICANPVDPPQPLLKRVACLHDSSICARGSVRGGGGAGASYWRATAAPRHIRATYALM